MRSDLWVRVRRLSVLTVGLLVIVAGACGDDDETGEARTTTSAATDTAASASSDFDAVVAAATEEGKVTIYSSHPLDQLEEFASRFEANYPGIEVETVRGVDGDLIARVETEQPTGSGADLVVLASQSWVEGHADMGWFVIPVGPNFTDSDYNADDHLHDGGHFEVGASIRTFGWNIDLYPEGLADYDDLLDPALQGGKIGIVDPGGAPVGIDVYLYLEANYGEDFVEKLAAQEPRIYAGGLPMAEALAAGEIAAGALVPVLTSYKEAGAPVESGIPSEELWGARFFGMILETADHPNAAQLLANFMISLEGQEALAKDDSAVLPDVPGTATTQDKVRHQDLAKLTPEFVTEYYAKWQSLFQ